jgi:heptaprenyl diphosphate synthase
MKRTWALAIEGMLVAAALILGWVERLLPPILPALPGVKLGLPNLAALLALAWLGARPALWVTAVRVLLGALLFGGLSALPYALAGGVLAWGGMVCARRWFGLPGVSLCGGVLHNAGQLCAAALLFGNAALFGYLPGLVLAGALCGFALGLAAQAVAKHIKGGT